MSKKADSFLVFLETSSDCQILAKERQRCKIYPAQLRIIALTDSAACWLDEHNWPFDWIWDCLEEDEIKGNAEKNARELTDNWHLDLGHEDSFYYGCTKPDFLLFFRHAFVAFSIIEKILNGCNRRVILFPQNSAVISPTLIDEMRVNGVFRAILTHFIKIHNIAHFCTRPSLHRRLYQFINPYWRVVKQVAADISSCHGSGLRRLLDVNRLVRFLSTTKRISRKSCCDTDEKKPSSSQSACDLLIANWGYDMERNMRLADAIDQSSTFRNLKCVHVIWGTDRCCLPQSLPVSHQVTYSRIRLPTAASYLWKFCVKDFLAHWLRFLSRRSRLKAQIPLFQNKLLSFEFLHLFFFSFRTAYLHGLRATSLIRNYRPRIFLTSDIDLPNFRAFIFTARNLGVTTATVNHAYYNWTRPEMQFVADWCFVGGEGVAHSLKFSGVSASRIKIVGNPLFAPTPQHCSTRQSLGRGGRFRIVVVTAGDTCLWSDTVNSYAGYRVLIKQLLMELGKRADWDIILKSHPLRDNHELYDHVVTHLHLPNIIHVRDGWKSQDEWRRCQVAVMPGRLSSALLQLQQEGIPVVFITESLGENQDKIFHFDYDGCGDVVHTCEEAVRAVTRLLEDENFRKEIITRGRSYLHRYTNCPQNSYDNFTEALQEVMESGKQ